MKNWFKALGIASRVIIISVAGVMGFYWLALNYWTIAAIICTLVAIMAITCVIEKGGKG